MKFNRGQGELLPGTEALYPVTITSVTTEHNALTIMGYSHHVNGRGNFIHGTIISARFTSPMPNVIRVQLSHFKGREPRLPAFDLDYQLNNSDAITGCDDEHAWLKAGDLSVVVPRKGEWHFNFQRGGKNLTESEPRA